MIILTLLLTIPKITFTFAQEGTVPKETCQLLKFELTHQFVNDPNINIGKLRPNQNTLRSLETIITSATGCSIVTDIRVFNITYDKTLTIISTFNVATYTETIKLQISADQNIKDRSSNLALCIENIKTEGFDPAFTNGLQLNVSGALEGRASKGATVDRQSCYHFIYGFSTSTNECCKTGFIEDGDNCVCPKGNVLNQTRCDACPEDTYKMDTRSISCVTCPNRTTTYGKTGADSFSFCKAECDRGYHYSNMSCIKCPRNTTQEKRGQMTCNICMSSRPITENDGTISQTDCIGVCPPGSYYNKLFLGCEQCDKSSYQPNRGTSQCFKCPDTHTTFEIGSTNMAQCIRACPPGSHHINRTKQCGLCDKDGFQSKWGQETCVKCRNDTMTFQVGSKSEADCFPVCSKGSYYNQTLQRCQRCPKNTYQNLTASVSCQPCPEDFITLPGGTDSLEGCVVSGKGTTVKSNQWQILIYVLLLGLVVYS